MVAAYSRRNARESSRDIDTSDEHASGNVSRALLSRSTIGFGLFGPVTLRRRERGSQRKCTSFFNPCALSLSGIRVAPSLNFPLFLGPRVLPLPFKLCQPPSTSRPDLVHLFRARFVRPKMLSKASCVYLLKHQAFEFRFFAFLRNPLNFRQKGRDYTRRIP